MHRTSHIINLKSSARIATKKSEKILHMLENIGRQTKVLKMVGMVAEREKRDVKERANEEYEQQRRAVWNWLGWGAWTEVYTEEERVKRAAELKDLEILMADIINISELGKLTERVEQMVRKDMKMWNAVMVASEKFLGKLVMKGEVESGDKNDEAVDNGRIFGIEEDEETGEKRGKRWFGSGSKGKGDEEMATKERIKQEKIGKRIEELREWGKDVRAWVKIRVKFAYDLRKLIEG
ncbi:hypothetical protein EAE99_011576 [Botrytis elliptica]|nr:hypothetical protein EAE99_011576 [Botrytis elliptica]